MLVLGVEAIDGLVDERGPALIEIERLGEPCGGERLVHAEQRGLHLGGQLLGGRVRPDVPLVLGRVRLRH